MLKPVMNAWRKVVNMGQYFIVVNLDKQEYINPHDLQMGAKLWEICSNNLGGFLLYLLRRSSEGGGGDVDEDMAVSFAGRWAGDKIAVVGDYDVSRLYDLATESWKNITKELEKEYAIFMQ
jgi:hypothetical protein